MTQGFAVAADTWTTNLTRSLSVNDPDMRGFDPSPITGPDDIFPDTSRPCCLDGSTEFGNGLPAGSSRESLNQNCDTFPTSEPGVTPGTLTDFGTGTIAPVPESAPFPVLGATNCNVQVTGNVFQDTVLFQQSRNGILSRPRAQTLECDSLGAAGPDQRCNEITFGFLQDVQSQGQVMELDFAIRSLTDADGNLIGAAEGMYTQTITEAGVTQNCSGTFTFDETNGFVMTSGPMHEC